MSSWALKLAGHLQDVSCLSCPRSCNLVVHSLAGIDLVLGFVFFIEFLGVFLFLDR